MGEKPKPPEERHLSRGEVGTPESLAAPAKTEPFKEGIIQKLNLVKSKAKYSHNIQVEGHGGGGSVIELVVGGLRSHHSVFTLHSACSKTRLPFPITQAAQCEMARMFQSDLT